MSCTDQHISVTGQDDGFNSLTDYRVYVNSTNNSPVQTSDQSVGCRQSLSAKSSVFSTSGSGISTSGIGQRQILREFKEFKIFLNINNPKNQKTLHTNHKSLFVVIIIQTKNRLKLAKHFLM